MFDTNNFTSTKKVTTKDVQDSIYENLVKKYGKRFHKYLITHNNSSYILFNWKVFRNIISEMNWKDTQKSFCFENPKFNEDTTEDETNNFLYMVAHNFTFKELINLPVVSDSKCIINKIIDPDLFEQWVTSNLKDILLASDDDQTTNLVSIFYNFNNKQCYYLVQYIVANLEDFNQVIDQNWYSMNLLFIITTGASEIVNASIVHTLAQNLADKVAIYGCIRNERYSLDNNIYYFGRMIYSVDHLQVNLPITLIQVLIENGSNINNQYVFTADSKRDVVHFLAIIDQSSLDKIKANLLKVHDYQINFNGFEKVVSDYKEGLKEISDIVPENQKRLDKLNMVLEKGIVQ